jgi:KDO2-lipid IV(A) lauroyltransferase
MANRLEFIVFSLLGLLLRLLPLRLVQFVGRRLGNLGYLFARRRRVIALDNLIHAFPEKSGEAIRKIARGAFQNFTVAMCELLWFPRFTPQRLRKCVRLVNVDYLSEVVARNKGVILMSGHFGNWELLGLSIGHFLGSPLTIIVKNQRNPLVNGVVNRYRCQWGNSVVPMELSVREALKKLTAGGVVAILADQSGPREGLFVPFFNRPAATHQGPAVFSLRVGAPIVFVFAIRQSNGSYRVISEEVSQNGLDGYSEENAAELTRRHVAVLEKYVRMYPEQWLWMHRRWKHLDKAQVWEGQEQVQPEAPDTRAVEAAEHP